MPEDPTWTAKKDSISLPQQVGLPGLRHSIGLARWWHLGIDTLWLVNGIVFFVLLFATGQWMRVVPLSWDVIPNSISVVIQYLSLDWPIESGWTNYNSLQLIAYFVTIFIAAPLALITGALENLNHMYAARNDQSWIGFWIFAASMVVIIVGWVAATPFTLRHPRLIQRAGSALIGPAERLFEHIDSEYKNLFNNDFRDYRLRVNGLVGNPVELSLAELRSMDFHEQITQHFCIQGWSGVAKWGGVSMQAILDLVKPTPEAKWVVFYSLGDGPDKGDYYDAHPIEQMGYQLTMLAYDVNGTPLSYGHGAPLRLRNEVQLGFKIVKWIKGIEFVADFSEVGGGFGGYNEDHEFFGYRQSI